MLATLALSATLSGTLVSPQAVGCIPPFDGSALSGAPGFLTVPTAVERRQGSWAVGYHETRYDIGAGQTTRVRTGEASIEFLPRLSLSARAAVFEETPARTGTLRDLSANAQLLLAREGAWTPAVAVGAVDVSGSNDMFASRYLTATRTWWRVLQTTLGYAGGRSDALNGTFGAVALGACRWFVAIAEHDGSSGAVGLRVSPGPLAGIGMGLEPTLDLFSREREGLVGHVSLRMVLPGAPRREALLSRIGGAKSVASPASSVGPSSSAVPPRREVAKGAAGIEHAIREFGLENVHVTASAEATLDVAYENRVYLRNEWLALGGVLEAAAAGAPPGTRTLRVHVLKLGYPVMAISTSLADLEAFLDGTLPNDVFAQRLVIDGGPGGAGNLPQMGHLNDDARWKLDVEIAPRIEPQMMNEASAVESRMSLIPEARMRIARGITVSGRKMFEVYSSDQFMAGSRPAGADRFVMNVTRPLGRVTPGRVPAAFAGVSLGRLGPREVGVVADADVSLREGAVSVRASGGVFGERVDRPDRSALTASVLLRDATRDLTVTITGGRFLHGDVGAAAELMRRFGDAEVAFFTRSTDYSSVAGVRLGVPLGPSRAQRPRSVRFRSVTFLDLSQHVTVLRDVPYARYDVAIAVDAGHDMPLVLRMRDQVHGVSLRAEIETVRLGAFAFRRRA